MSSDKDKARDASEKARGYMLAQEAVREIICRWGRELARRNLTHLEADKSREPFDVGYLEGYRDMVHGYR
jgi:hypothetical protein